MARGDLLQKGLRQRILNSEIKLEVQYPAVRPVVDTGSQTLAPFSPLTGPKPTATLIPVAPTPDRDAVQEVPCLWLDTISKTLQRRELIDSGSIAGWKQGAEAMARVLVESTALDVDAPYAGTIFDAADAVVAHGKRWKVLAVEPISSGFKLPFTYAVWLKGMAVE